ncbi:uncharacterized protein LOC132266649 [Cornus florida]|uniref:uncharacterized protein LOC132266649 n=1 Tax=Cornus florida TaxID=4283 RepID=UPI0028967B6C|nr:uncharacterized protein LOC132266649 [Cornus florida]
MPQSSKLPIPRKFRKLGIEHPPFLHEECSGCFPYRVLFFRYIYEFLGVFSATFPSSAAKKRLSFLKRQVWSDPPSVESLLISVSLKAVASRAVCADLMDLSLPSFDSFPMTEEEKQRAKALKKKAAENAPLTILRTNEQEKDINELPLNKRARLNPFLTAKSKGASNPKSKGKKSEEINPDDEVNAYVLAEAGAPCTPSFSRADKSILHVGDSMITDPFAALAVARGMWLPKDEEIIGRMRLEQLLPSSPVRAIEVCSFLHFHCHNCLTNFLTLLLSHDAGLVSYYGPLCYC